MTRRERLLTCLDRVGMTQAGLARKLRCSSQTVSYMLNERRPLIEVIAKTARVLAVDLEWLLFGTHDRRPKWWDAYHADPVIDPAQLEPVTVPVQASAVVVPTTGGAESDPTGRVPHQPGTKLDAGKAPVLRGALGYFPRALAAVSQVSAHGAAKYTWDGWRTVPNGAQRYGDALVRHLAAETEGATDRDSGLRHAAHAAWNALARLELLLDVDADQAR